MFCTRFLAFWLQLNLSDYLKIKRELEYELNRRAQLYETMRAIRVTIQYTHSSIRK